MCGLSPLDKWWMGVRLPSHNASCRTSLSTLSLPWHPAAPPEALSRGAAHTASSPSSVMVTFVRRVQRALPLLIENRTSVGSISSAAHRISWQ